MVGGAVDPASKDWLGRHHDRDEIRESGLWNIECVRQHPLESREHGSARPLVHVAGAEISS